MVLEQESLELKQRIDTACTGSVGLASCPDNRPKVDCY